MSPPTTPARRKQRPKRNGDPNTRGRPHDLDRPVTFGGQTLPAAQAVVTIMRSGEPLYLAADACGLGRETCYGWRRDGTRIASELHEGRVTPDQLTDYETAAVAFSEGVTRAEAEAEAMMAARLGTVAAGGYVRRRTVTERDGDGNVTLVRETEETMPPDPKALTFWLERRGAARWARTQRVEHALGSGEPRAQTESPLDVLAEKLRAIDRRKTAGAKLTAVETTAVEDGAA